MASTSPTSGRNRPQRALHRAPTGGTGCHPGCGPARHHHGSRIGFSPSWARPLRGAPRIVHDAVAVTPVVGTLIILAISSVGIAAVMTWGLPNVQQTQAVTELDGVLNQFYAIDHIADGVMRGGAIDKASEGNLNIPKGQIELTNGTLFVISWFPNHTDRNDRFWLTGVGDDTPQTFTIHAGDPVAATGDFVDVDRVKGGDVQSIYADQGSSMSAEIFNQNTATSIDIDLGERALEERPTRIRVIEEDGDIEFGPFLMEAWILPSGSLHYLRQTSFGLAGFRLENSVVISEMETGNTLRNQALGTIERNVDDKVTFIGLFQMILIDDENRPGVQAAGAGSYPLLFALKANNLRADGVETEAVYVDAIGPHAGLWEANYVNTMGFEYLNGAEGGDDHPYATDPLEAGTTPAGVFIEAPEWTGQPTWHDPFDFVLLESIIGVSLQLETADLGTGV